MPEWSPSSWRAKPAAHLPKYPDPQALADAVSQVAVRPPLVTLADIDQLKSDLAAAVRGERFLLQGGDCAESFADCSPKIIGAKLRTLSQMGAVLTHGCRMPVIRVVRLAGQYTKPRTSPTETHDGVTLPNYFGDSVNRREFSAEARQPDPQNLLTAYERSAATLDILRRLARDGFTDLCKPEAWDLSFVPHSARAHELRLVLDGILRALSEAGASGNCAGAGAELFTSHEGLHLYYEEALTRQAPDKRGWYDLSTHFPWIGHRSRAFDGAHVEHFRGVRNPIGIKIGPPISAEELVELVEVLDPDNEPGRLTLIHRFGADTVATDLPPLVEALTRRERAVLWSCDPMHGNTTINREGYKTRDFASVLAELQAAQAVHRECGSRLAGVHFEMTGELVTECTGGARGLDDSDLPLAYRSCLDPRLNQEQALEIALLVARGWQKESARAAAER